MTDKDTKKALLKNWKAQEAEKAINQFPLDNAQLDRFFSELDDLMSEVSCSHDQRHANSVIANMRLSPEQSRTLLDWCKVNGGYCDCEILGNTCDRWNQYRGQIKI